MSFELIKHSRTVPQRLAVPGTPKISKDNIQNFGTDVTFVTIFASAGNVAHPIGGSAQDDEFQCLTGSLMVRKTRPRQRHLSRGGSMLRSDELWCKYIRCVSVERLE